MSGGVLDTESSEQDLYTSELAPKPHGTVFETRFPDRDRQPEQVRFSSLPDVCTCVIASAVCSDVLLNGCCGRLSRATHEPRLAWWTAAAADA